MPDSSKPLRDRLAAAELELRRLLTEERQPRVLVVSRFGLDALGGEREERWPCERIAGIAGMKGVGEGFLELRRLPDTRVLGWEWETQADQPPLARECAFPVWLAARLGIRSSVVLASGDPLAAEPVLPRLALVRDHIRLFGDDPLSGWASPREGVRHPQLPDLYDPGLRSCAASRLEALGLAGVERVAMDRPGPSGPTPAEKEAFRRLGAEVMLEGGLAEAIAARHVGLRHAMVLLLLGPSTEESAGDPGILADQAESLFPPLASLLEHLLPAASQEIPL